MKNLRRYTVLICFCSMITTCVANTLNELCNTKTSDNNTTQQAETNTNETKEIFAEIDELKKENNSLQEKNKILEETLRICIEKPICPTKEHIERLKNTLHEFVTLKDQQETMVSQEKKLMLQKKIQKKRRELTALELENQKKSMAAITDEELLTVLEQDIKRQEATLNGNEPLQKAIIAISGFCSGLVATSIYFMWRDKH